MKLKVRLGCVHSTDVELGQGRSLDLISWLFRDIIRLIRDGGKGGWRWGNREIIYLSLHSHHHQNDSFIKMCSDESHFNVSLIVRDKVTRQSPQTTTFLKSRKGELKRNRAEILLLTRLVRTRSRLYWERERERERVSLCRVSLFLCSVGVDCMTAPTPPPSPTHHPSSQCSVDCMTDILSPPPPTHTHTHTHTHTYTHTQQISLSLPELCWLHDCLACVCAAPSCVDVPEDCSIYFWEPLHQQCPRDVILNSSTGAYDWVVNMDCVDSRSQTLDCQALGQLLRNPQPRRNSRRNGYRFW